MNVAIENRIIRSRIQMLVKMPFFGILALNLTLKEDASVGTAGTDGKMLYYNPEFIQKLSEAELNFLIAHEVLHPALKHLWRKKDRQHLKWNIACDHAINILITDSDPSGQTFKFISGGYCDKQYKEMTAEAIYDVLPNQPQQKGNGGESSDKDNNGNDKMDGNSNGNAQGKNFGDEKIIGNHDVWKKSEISESEANEWDAKVKAALEAHKQKNQGNLPAGLKRLYDSFSNPQKNWRVLLNEFIIEQNSDYSFNPPDRRYSDGDFYLPEFNEVEEEVKDIVFWVDTSGSIGAKELNAVMSEIVGAIQQMNGKLQGYIGFFDSVAYPLTPFDSISSLVKVEVRGGGGTCFFDPFRKTNDFVESGHEVAGVIMLTDGYASFPPESITNDIPTLWLITNEDVKPTFGLHTTIKI